MERAAIDRDTELNGKIGKDMTKLSLSGGAALRLATDNGATMPPRREDDVRALVSRHAGLTPLGQAITALCDPISVQLGLTAAETASLVGFARFLSTRSATRTIAA